MNNNFSKYNEENLVIKKYTFKGVTFVHYDFVDPFITFTYKDDNPVDALLESYVV